MEINKIKGAIEAILFASGEPIEVIKIAQALDVEEDIVRKLLRTMQDKYDADDSGIMLCEMGDCFQLCTKPVHAPYIKQALEMKRNNPLSQAAMEILAIIAYNQPVTKGFIEQIRGVDSSSTVNSLVEKGLIEEAGRLDVPGRPIAYQTTANFLRNFGLTSLEELPPLPDDSGQIMFDEVVNRDHQNEDHIEADA